MALIYDSSYEKSVPHQFTYKDLQNQVGRLASILTKQFGVTKGDRVIIYMPMIPESVFCMLACARIGAIHSVVFGGFAPKELAHRIDDCLPKLIITASCGLEPGKIIYYRPNVEEAMGLCASKELHKKVKILIVQRPNHYVDKDLDPDKYLDFDQLMEEEQDIAPCVPVESVHPLYILCKHPLY